MSRAWWSTGTKGAPMARRDRPAYDDDPEVWWIETTPTRFGWNAIAKSNRGLAIGVSVDGFGGFPLWRPTEWWARRALLRIVRGYLARKRLEAEAEERTRIYPVEL